MNILSLDLSTKSTGERGTVDKIRYDLLSGENNSGVKYVTLIKKIPYGKISKEDE